MWGTGRDLESDSFVALTLLRVSSIDLEGHLANDYWHFSIQRGSNRAAKLEVKHTCSSLEELLDLPSRTTAKTKTATQAAPKRTLNFFNLMSVPAVRFTAPVSRAASKSRAIGEKTHVTDVNVHTVQQRCRCLLLSMDHSTRTIGPSFYDAPPRRFNRTRDGTTLLKRIVGGSSPFRCLQLAF